MGDEFKLGELTGQIEGINGKIDALSSTIQNFTQGIATRVEKQGERIASAETAIENHRGYIGSVSGDLKKHIDGHWKWIGYLGAGFSIFTGFLYFIKEHLKK